MIPRVVSVLVAVAILVGTTACGIAAQDEATRHDPDDVPLGLLEPATTTSQPAGGGASRSVEVCLVRGERLVVLARETETGSTLEAAVELLEAGPAQDLEVASGLRTEVPDGAVRNVSTGSGVATVELVEGFTDLQADAQLLAVAQLVCTLTGQRGVGQIRFSLNGAEVSVPRQDGSLSAQPVSRDDYRNLIEGAR